MAVGSFSAGLSGLNANATALSVIGNNLANINTIAHRGRRYSGFSRVRKRSNSVAETAALVR